MRIDYILNEMLKKVTTASIELEAKGLDSQKLKRVKKPK